MERVRTSKSKRNYQKNTITYRSSKVYKYVKGYVIDNVTHAGMPQFSGKYWII